MAGFKNIRVGVELFELIRSLTTTEDTAVRNLLPKKKAEMYSFFREMEQYNAKAVKVQFSNMSDQNRATTERQLIDMILDILWNSIYKHGVRDLIQHLGEAEILMKRALYNIAFSKIRSAIKKAIAMDAMHELLMALRMKRELVEILQVPDFDPEEELHLGQIAVAGMMERLKVDDIQLRIAGLRNKSIPERKNRLTALKAEIDAMPYPALRRNQICFHRCKHFLSYLEGEHLQCAYHCNEVIVLVENDDEILGDPQAREDFYNSLHFKIIFEIERKNLVLAEQLLAKFEVATAKWSGGIGGDHSINGRHTHAALFLNIFKKNWDSVGDLAKKVLRGLQGAGQGISIKHKPAWLQMTLLASFITGDYDTVRKLSVELKNVISSFYLGNAFLSGIAIFYLAALYEENDEFLETATKQTRRWLKDNKCSGPYEARMLRFFEKSSKESTFIGRSTLLKGLRKDLKRMFNDPLLWRHRDIFPVMQWIEAKIDRADIRGYIVT